MMNYRKLTRNNYFLCIFILLVILLDFFIVSFYTLKVEITLDDGDEINIIYPNKFKDGGYSAKLLNLDLTSKVNVSGKVDDTKVGRYEIKYNVDLGFFETTKVQVINILDNEAPVITLKGEEKTYICKKATYKEDGYEVVDNYDKDLFDKVVIKQNGNKYIYSVEDSSGNMHEVVREVIKKDIESPKIELTKGNINIVVGSEYSDPGYKAVDNCDGDITSKVSVEGSIDPNTVGTYEIKYRVVDSSGHEDNATRVVTVTEEQVKASMNVGTPGMIYLTFDDGPGAGTEKILNVLKEQGVKATFFVTCGGKDELLLREANEGHTIALHTASHVYKTVYSSLDGYYADLNKVADRVKRVTGVDTKIIRFPGGSSNTISKGINRGIMTTITNSVLENGYHYFDWNVDSNDAGTCAKTRTADCVFNNVTKNLSKAHSNVVLMHDIKTYTADALERIIKYGKENGYSFDVITMDTPMVRHKVNN